MVGSANGRSMIASTVFLPRNSSRTSTHASAVPKTALMATTISEMTSVSRRAATVCSFVIVSQNAAQPPSPAFQASAAIGRATTMPR